MNSITREVCKQFTTSPIKKIEALGNGLINDTFLVKTSSESFVLQRINSQVFSNPKLIMENMRLLNQQMEKNEIVETALKIPRILKTTEHANYYHDKQNTYWRAIEYIDNTISKESLNNLHEAEQIGFALGYFHRLLSEVNINSYHDTLPGFHITPQYYEHYLVIEKQHNDRHNSVNSQFCKQFILSFAEKNDVLENAKNNGFLRERIIHGDPKLNNFLFDKHSNNIISLIDLDTVKPGLVHYDIADCLRSCCHDVQTDTFDLEICGVLLNSYLQQAHYFFSDQDYEYLYAAIELLPFELGLRFFTDYLEGDRYFKVDLAAQNLNRAIAQFRLAENIAKQEKEIRNLIDLQCAQSQ